MTDLEKPVKSMTDLEKINLENLNIMKSKPGYEKTVIEWLENSLNELDPVYVNHVIFHMFEENKNKRNMIVKASPEIPKSKYSSNERISKKAPKLNESDIFFNKNPDIFEKENQIIEKNEENSTFQTSSWKIFSFSNDKNIDMERFFESGFNIDYEIKEKIQNSLIIHDNQTVKMNKNIDFLGEYNDNKGVNIIFIKNLHKKIEKPKLFFHKLMKINFILHHLIRKFNSLFDHNKIYFSKGLILKKNDEILYAEKPLKKENLKDNIIYIEYFAHWIYEISNQKLVCEIKNTGILTDFILHSYNGYFEEFKDEGFDKMEEIMQNHKCNHLCKYLKPYAKQIYKKCQNIFCNKFTFQKFCENCFKIVKEEEKKWCTICKNQFTIKPNEYIFKGKSVPNICHKC